MTSDPLAGQKYTCALAEADAARAFGDCLDHLGRDGKGAAAGAAKPPPEPALAPLDMAEALRQCAWLLYSELPTDMMGPAARLSAFLGHLDGRGPPVEEVVAEATRVRAPPRFAPADDLPLLEGENAASRRDAVRVWRGLRLQALAGWPLWEESLFSLLRHWHCDLRAVYDAYATPLKAAATAGGGGGGGGGAVSNSDLLPRGQRLLRPEAWEALVARCGLDGGVPAAEVLQQAVRDTAAARNPARSAAAAGYASARALLAPAAPAPAQPADYVSFVQALISLSHATAVWPRATAAPPPASRALPRCFDEVMRDAVRALSLAPPAPPLASPSSPSTSSRPTSRRCCRARCARRRASSGGGWVTRSRWRRCSAPRTRRSRRSSSAAAGAARCCRG